MLVIRDEHLARQLKTIADNEKRSVEDVLKTLLADYPAQENKEIEEPKRGSWEWLVAHLDELAFSTGNPIDPEQADDILNAEYADYILSLDNDAPTSDPDRQ